MLLDRTQYLPRTSTSELLTETSAKWATTALQELRPLLVPPAKEDNTALITTLSNLMEDILSIMSTRNAMPDTSAAASRSSLLQLGLTILMKIPVKTRSGLSVLIKTQLAPALVDW